MLFFTKYKPLQTDYDKTVEQNKYLERQQDTNHKYIVKLRNEIYDRDVIIKERENRIDEIANELDESKRREKEALQKLNNLTLEEIISYITAYYGVDISEVEIVKYDNEIRVAFKESLVRDVASTITKLESANVQLSVYEKEVFEYDLLVSDYEYKIDLLNKQDSLNVNNYNLEKDKNKNLQTLIDNRNKKIKSLTTQRTVIGGIAVVVIVIALI